jgi:hypothetical protein
VYWNGRFIQGEGVVEKETECFKGQVFLNTYFSPNPTKTLIRDDGNWKVVKNEIARIKKLVKVRLCEEKSLDE